MAEPRRSPFVPARRDEPELMDAPGLPPAEVADAYRVLRRINGWFFGGRRPLRLELRRFLDDEGPNPKRGGGGLTLVEVGSGSGDLALSARDELARLGHACQVVALDLDPTALDLARRDGLPGVRADALRLPLGDQSVDVVLAVKFAHHFAGPALDRLLAEMARVARGRVIVLDIRRSWSAYWGFVAWSRVFTRNRLVRHDGPLSVLRGFTAAELADAVAPLPGYAWEVRGHWGYQLALVGRRQARMSRIGRP